MTPATTRPVGAIGSTVTIDRGDKQSVVRTVVPSGWYDPDGAAWESETLPATEILRAAEIRPMILVEGADPIDN
jgi:hypothetical protein